MSLMVDRFGHSYLCHGPISIGYVHAIGITQAQAMQKAGEQIRQMQHEHIEGKFAEFRAEYPEYFEDEA